MPRQGRIKRTFAKINGSWVTLLGANIQDIYNGILGGLNFTNKVITHNGTYNAHDEGVDGYTSVTINVGDDGDIVEASYNLIVAPKYSEIINVAAGIDRDTLSASLYFIPPYTFSSSIEVPPIIDNNSITLGLVIQPPARRLSTTVPPGIDGETLSVTYSLTLETEE